LATIIKISRGANEPVHARARPSLEERVPN
jgi:hypothetical protein